MNKGWKESGYKFGAGARMVSQINPLEDNMGGFLGHFYLICAIE